jgi:hypothetical protein
MARKIRQDIDPVERLHSEQMKELHDIKKLLVLLLLNDGVQKGEIEEILEIGNRNFAKFYRAGKIVDRVRKEEEKNGEE